jgi:hypothetical protein
VVTIPSLEMPAFVERLRDRRFEHTRYSERRFLQPHEWCEVCGKMIAERPLPEAASSGMVSLFVIEAVTGSPWAQWEWVCESCFSRYQEVARWSLLGEGESVGEASRPTGQAFTKASGAAHEPSDHWSVSWSLDDVIGIARTVGASLSEEEGPSFMARQMPVFSRRVKTFGDTRMVGLLKGERLTPKDEDLSRPNKEREPAEIIPGSELPIGFDRWPDRKFEHARYSERRFFQPYARCSICGQMIAERPYPEATSSGMVSLFFIEATLGSPWAQWDWLCESCFVLYQEVARWSLLGEGESVGQASRPTGPVFETVSEAGKAPSDHYSISWSLDDVIGSALIVGVCLSEEEGRRFMENYMPLFLERVMAFGDIRLAGLLLGEYPTPKDADSR